MDQYFQQMLSRLVVMGIVLSMPLGAAAQIPPAPAEEGEGFFTHDYAQVLNGNSTARIAAAQARAFQQHNTMIIVVSIRSMREYGHSGTIESFAREWFDAWSIGANQPNGASKGILLLVSIGDRKARIELGRDWQGRWDNYCQRIMSENIVPYFRSGAYSDGIASGVERLAEMAASGPGGATPQAVPFPANKARHGEFPRQNDFPRLPIRGLGGGCLTCCFVPFILIISVVNMIFRSFLGLGRRGRRYRSSGWGGFGGGSFGGISGGFSSGGHSSGGHSSGGHSSGGGATGSW